MNKQQVLALLIALLAIILLYSFPKYVVENQKLETAEQLSGQNVVESVENSHGSALNPNNQSIINSLKEKLSQGLSKNSINFADSLAKLYLVSNISDSAVWVADQILSLEVEEGNYLAANIFYGASISAKDEVISKEYITKAKIILEGILEENPDNLNAKAKLAVTKVSGENPMEGIFMLREVLEKEPDHWDANFNLGLLSIQSRQFDKAIERFSKLVGLRNDDIQANYYLAVSYFENQNLVKAKEIFELLKNKTNDVIILQSVDDYLDNIEKLLIN